MAAPWTRNVKVVTRPGHTLHRRAMPSASLLFSAPTPLLSLRIHPKSLFAAMAKMQALRFASPALVGALAYGAAAVTAAIVDEVGSQFDLTVDAEELESTFRRSLAGSIGAGICHLCMVAMGYVWHAYAADIISTRRKLADFIYEGGPLVGRGTVLAEAKGSFSSRVSGAQVRQVADSAYRQQVEPYIGRLTTKNSRSIVHGYAVAFGVQPASVRIRTAPPNAFLHVAETATGVSGSDAAESPSGDSADVDPYIALSNYRAAFMLSNATSIVSAVDAVRGLGSTRALQAQSLYVVRAGGREFFLAEESETQSFRPFKNTRTFAVDAEVAAEFLGFLTEIVRGRGLDRALTLPRVNRQLVFEDDGDLVLFPDGFATLASFEIVARRSWSPSLGLGPRL